MKRHKHTHPLLPPTLFISHIDGQKYIVPGWTKVNSKTTLEDIEWVKEKIMIPKSQIQTFQFPSSSGSEIYITKKYINPDNSIKYTCNCPGGWRVKDKTKGCKHVQQIRSGWVEWVEK
jgi:hypothetical protein